MSHIMRWLLELLLYNYYNNNILLLINYNPYSVLSRVYYYTPLVLCYYCHRYNIAWLLSALYVCYQDIVFVKTEQSNTARVSSVKEQYSITCDESYPSHTSLRRKDRELIYNKLIIIIVGFLISNH